MVNGRGAWNNQGVGGTRKYKDSTKPGPYYFIGTGSLAAVPVSDNDAHTVKRAVVAYQNALTGAGFPTKADGYFGTVTSQNVLQFQIAHPECGTPWGGIGPDSSKALLLPALKSAVALSKNSLVTANMVSGTIYTESMWDAGAVGYVDPTDLGLAQINGKAHPEMSEAFRLVPANAFAFVVGYYENALSTFDNNVRDAVASYNLGAGGTRQWIKAGRPDVWTPQGVTTSRNVKAYIDKILAG